MESYTRLLLKRLGRWPNYVQAFGAWNGTVLDLQIERSLATASSQLRSFRVPGHQAPIWLRDCVADHATFWQCIVRSQYDLQAFPHFEKLRRRYEQQLAQGRAPLILDAGGNIGLSVIVLARAFPKARVVVVEPDAANFEVLLKNVEHLGSRVVPVRGAIWPRQERVRIVNPEAGAAAYRVEAAADGLGVSGYTVEELMQQHGDGEMLLAKFDIEGAQKTLFTGPCEWLDHTDALTIELDDWQFPWQQTSTTFFRAVAAREFEYLMNGENLVCFNAQRLA